MENTFQNTMDTNKASPTGGQAVYKCGLCSKEYFHYRDLALHERGHLNQMSHARSLQGGTLPSYHESRTANYSTGNLAPTTLESFEKIAPPFHSESQMRAGGTEPRSISQGSPAPLPQRELDKVPLTYRTESDTRSVVDTRSPVPDNRNVAVEPRTVPVDQRPLSRESRSVQSPDGRHIPHSAAHTLSYSSTQYLDNIAHPLYSGMNNKHPPTSTFGAYPAPPAPHSADYFSRNQILPKLGPQIYGKSESYYPAEKTHYSHIPEKPHDVYASNQYGVSKTLGQTQDPYYPSSPHSSQVSSLSKYEADKMASLPVSSYYTQQSLSKQEIRIAGQKSTLYYGPQEVTSLPSSTSNISYHMTAPKINELSNPHVREPVNKLPERPIANRPFPPGHVSPHLPYSDIYKGSHLQPQVFSSLPSQISPSQVDYNTYKPAVEPVPSVNLHAEGNNVVRQYPLEYTCHLCHLNCTNALLLSEHMKIHAMAQSAPLPNYVPQIMSAGSSFTQPASSLKQQPIPENSLASSTSSSSVYKAKDSSLTCSICCKTFLQVAYLEEHRKTHHSSEENKYQCKTCDKCFTTMGKYVRHEAQHKRNASFLYCEFCMASFENKGNYLHHMTKKHGPPNATSNVVEGPSKPAHNVNVGPKLIVDNINIVDCQICDLEVYRDKLVEHLATHPLFMCRICDCKFVQNSELVEHLMKQHSKELEASDSNRNSSVSKEVKPSESNLSVMVQKPKLEEEDSGLEEDKDEDTRESVNKTLKKEPVNVNKVVEDKEKKKDESVLKIESTTPSHTYQSSQGVMDGNVKSKSENIDKKAKKTEMKNLKDNLQKKSDNDNTVTGNKHPLDNSEFSELEIRDKKMKFSCSKCDRSFAKHGDLVQHVEAHNKDPSRIYCEVCELSYHIKEKGYYIYHMKYHKDSEMIHSDHPAQLPCIVCKKEFKKQVLVSHIISQHTQFSCDICQWSYSSETSFITHMKRIHAKKFQNLKDIRKIVENKSSPVVYRKLKDLKAEEQDENGSKIKDQEQKKKYQCDVCRKTLTKKSFYEKHMLKHNLSAEEQQISCNLCDINFASKGTYFYHILKDHSKSTNIESQGHGDIHIKSSDLKKEAASTHSKDADAVVNLANIKLEHVKQILTTVLNPETGVFEEKLVDEPEDIDMKVVGKACEKVNNEVNSNDNIDLKDEMKVNIKDVVYCKLCNKSLNIVDLLSHMKTHPFYHCDSCRFTYTKKKPYQHHVRLLHLEQLVNEEIDKLKQLEALKKGPIETKDEYGKPVVAKEKRRRSETAKLMACPLCSGEFKQHLYIQHLNTHLPQSWKCQFCSRKFTKKSILVIHEKSHERVSHGTLPYPLYCPSCNISLKSRSNYIEHMCSEHLKKSPFKCKLCSETFLFEKGAECHMRCQHDSNGRFVWKLDGEGVKFDVRTGRIFDTTSDYIQEIREINDLFLHNGKPEIWTRMSRKRGRGKRTSESTESEDSSSSDTSSSDDDDDDDDEDESDEKPKMDTSDGDYIPKNILPKIKQEPAKEKSEVDDNDSSDDDSSSLSSSSSSSSSSSDDDEQDDVNKDPDVSIGSRLKDRRTDKIDDEKYKPRGTRTRQQKGDKSPVKRQQTPIRGNSSGAISRRSSPRSGQLNSKQNESVEKVKAVKRKSDDVVSGTRNTRAKVEKVSQSVQDKNHKDETAQILTKCPCCVLRFNCERKLHNHLRCKHKSYKAKRGKPRSLASIPSSGRLRTRNRNLRSNVSELSLLNMPMRRRAVVKISPLQMEIDETRIVKTKNPEKPIKTAKLETSTSPGRMNKLKCPYCKKLLFNNKSNYDRHIKTHEKAEDQLPKDEKDQEAEEKDESKGVNEGTPFSCKVCSKTFQKKRGLYMHSKTHAKKSSKENKAHDTRSASSISSDVSMDTETTVKSDLSAKKDKSESDLNTSALNVSQGESKQEVRSDPTPFVGSSDADNVKNGHSRRRKSVLLEDKKATLIKQTVETHKTNEQLVNSPTDKCDENSSDSKTPNDSESLSVKGLVEQQENMNKNGSKSITDHETNSANDNSEVNNKEENDTDDRSKITRNLPAVTKMTAEAALSKWKSKVTATLSSQLELHATKRQAELANPEAAKIKDFLSKSGKPVRKNFECRICGDMFDLENKFQDHMDVHLKQSPPYCSLCNMYFMAIYPIRRLLEHNKKKHPDLVKTSASLKPL